MSWGYGITAVPLKEVAEKLKEAQAASFATYTEAPSQGVIEQAELANHLAQEAVESGVVGNTTHSFSISVSGHANPDHEPDPSYANDMITINIYQSLPTKEGSG